MFGNTLQQDNNSLENALNSLQNSPVFSDSSPSVSSTSFGNSNNPISNSISPDLSSALPKTAAYFQASPDNVSFPVQEDTSSTSKLASHPSFFSSGGAGQRIAGIIGDALLLANGRYPLYLPSVMEHNRQIEQQNGQQQQREANATIAAQKLSQQQSTAAMKATKPQYHFGTDGRVLALDPLTGETSQLRDPDTPNLSEHERMINRIINLPADDPERRLTEQALLGKNRPLMRPLS
ncbi:MAG: hypothetical protein ABF461_04290 [Zymomonas mobilis subsp. pomaceae]|nr:hypothetical protein [Zymomonas mobilis]MDX5949079.1 hypothetical protein [Zymomonas mobilis subsp. pomaceae]